MSQMTFRLSRTQIFSFHTLGTRGDLAPELLVHRKDTWLSWLKNRQGLVPYSNGSSYRRLEKWLEGYAGSGSPTATQFRGFRRFFQGILLSPGTVEYITKQRSFCDPQKPKAVYEEHEAHEVTGYCVRFRLVIRDNLCPPVGRAFADSSPIRSPRLLLDSHTGTLC